MIQPRQNTINFKGFRTHMAAIIQCGSCCIPCATGPLHTWRCADGIPMVPVIIHALTCPEPVSMCAVPV